MIRKLWTLENEWSGTIYSLVCVRPGAADEQGDMGPFIFHEDGKSLSINTVVSNQETFTFDRVFGTHAQQTDLFEPVSDHVQSALDGCQVCILLYGESRSVKVRVIKVLLISMIAFYSSFFACVIHPDAHNSRRCKT
jgi:kinesin family protein C1